MEGQIIYIDQFGNLITNITKEYIAHLERNYKLNRGMGSGIGWEKPELRSKKPDAFEKTSKGKTLSKHDTMETTIGKKKIVGLSKTYTDAKPENRLSSLEAPVSLRFPSIREMPGNILGWIEVTK